MPANSLTTCTLICHCIHRLRGLPILENLDEDVINALAACFTSKRYGPGDTIATEGQRANKVIIVKSGTVRGSTSHSQGNSSLLLSNSVGDCSGNGGGGGEGSWFGEQLFTGVASPTFTATVRSPLIFVVLLHTYILLLLSGS